MIDDTPIGNSAIDDNRIEPHHQLALDTLQSRFGSIKLVWRALLLDEDVYRDLMQQPALFVQGVISLLVILLLVALARAIGYMLTLWTSLRFETLQEGMYQIITQTEWYAQNIASAPATANGMDQLYGLLWQGVHFFVGLPLWGNILLSVLLIVVGYIIVWMLHGIIAHGLIRWQGGQGELERSMGALALAAAPLTVTIITFLPGLSVATSLIFLWILIGQYQALKVAHGLSWPRTLVAVAGPYLIMTLLALGGLLFATSMLLSN